MKAYGFDKLERTCDGDSFSLSSPKGGEGWGEEAIFINRSHPGPLPAHSSRGEDRFLYNPILILFVPIPG